MNPVSARFEDRGLELEIRKTFSSKTYVVKGTILRHYAGQKTNHGKEGIAVNESFPTFEQAEDYVEKLSGRVQQYFMAGAVEEQRMKELREELKNESEAKDRKRKRLLDTWGYNDA